MADERYINVFLDTHFFDSNQLDFANKTFEVLRLNVAAGHIHVFSTGVTQREVERHVRERAAKAHERLQLLRKDSLLRHVKQAPFDFLRGGPTDEDIEGVMLSQFTQCWKSLRTTTLPVNNVNVSALLDDYFEVRPPFGSGKKKAEFPDAIAVHTLRGWCRANGQMMHVVSGDPDWQAVCSVVPEFILKKEVAEVLERFPDAGVSKTIREWMDANVGEVRKAIARAFSDYLFFGKTQAEWEMRTVEVTRVRVDEAYVIHLDNGLATVEVPCKVAYDFMKVRTVAPDIHYLITMGDPEKIIRGRSKSKAVAEMTIRYNVGSPGDCQIEAASISLRRPYATLEP
jgi:PIN domain